MDKEITVFSVCSCLHISTSVLRMREGITYRKDWKEGMDH